MSSALLCVLPLVPQKPSGGFWSFATAGWLWLEMRTMKQVLALLVLEQLPTILSPGDPQQRAESAPAQLAKKL